jgi:hypothetical protein
MEAIRDDPMYYIREHVKQVHGCGLYQVLLPWHALNCYVDDSLVPGTRTYKRNAKLLDILS